MLHEILLFIFYYRFLLIRFVTIMFVTHSLVLFLVHYQSSILCTKNKTNKTNLNFV